MPVSLLSEVKIMVTLGVGLEGGRMWSPGVQGMPCHDPVLSALMGSVWENLGGLCL